MPSTPTQSVIVAVMALAACRGADVADPSSPGPADTATAPLDGPTVVTDGDGLFGAPFPASGRMAAAQAFPNPDDVDIVTDVLTTLPTDESAGYSRTSAIWFPLTGPIDTAALPSPAESLQSDAAVQLVALDTGERHPIDVHFEATEQPFAPAHLLTLLPVQGVPLRADTDYAAVLTTRLGLRPAAAPAELAWDGPDAVAGATLFHTGAPTSELDEAVAVARDLGLPSVPAPQLVETHDAFCVYETEVPMPVFQQGDPPYLGGGGGWHPDLQLQRQAPSRLFLTIPRAPGPWPVAVMVRTGGGGDRPLIDRGPRAEAGGEAIEPGTGPALHFAAAGVAGAMVDGPLGGLRNPQDADEQFLIFNVTNPVAMRDNLRQSALELALLPELLDELAATFDPADCAAGSLDTSRIALFGHSMGATIAPLAVAAQPRYELLLLSGAGGSWIENIVHKQLPLEVRPLAEAMLDYDDRELHRHDPFLAMLQWGGEAADPPAYAHRIDADVFMMQGIVDRYILPPIANTTSLSLGLDRLGAALDEDHTELASFRPLSELQPLVGAGEVSGEVAGNVAGRTRVVVQYPEGPVEDGHEVAFQTDAPKAAYEQVLATWAAGQARVPADAQGPADR